MDQSTGLSAFEKQFHRIYSPEKLIFDTISPLVSDPTHLSSFPNMTDTYVDSFLSRWIVHVSPLFCSVKKTTTSTTVITTTASVKKAVPKVPEVLLKKRKIHADLKARRLRAQVQGTKVNRSSVVSTFMSVPFSSSKRNSNVCWSSNALKSTPANTARRSAIWSVWNVRPKYVVTTMFKLSPLSLSSCVFVGEWKISSHLSYVTEVCLLVFAVFTHVSNRFSVCFAYVKSTTVSLSNWTRPRCKCYVLLNRTSPGVTQIWNRSANWSTNEASAKWTNNVFHLPTTASSKDRSVGMSPHTRPKSIASPLVLGKQDIICMEDLVHEIFTVGDSFKKASNFLWPFKLNNPKGTVELFLVVREGFHWSVH